MAFSISPAWISGQTSRLRSIAPEIRLGLFLPRRVQHVVDHLVALAGMADADTQSPEVRAELRGDVLQPVVPGDAAALLEPRRARRQVELVVHDQDLVGLDLVERGQMPAPPGRWRS